jgi:hypothetical protein
MFRFFGVFLLKVYNLKWARLAAFRALLLRFSAKTKKKPALFEVSVTGGDSRTRTCDLPRVKRMLYRLSYASGQKQRPCRRAEPRRPGARF